MDVNFMLVHCVATLDTAGCAGEFHVGTLCEFHVGILRGNFRHCRSWM